MRVCVFVCLYTPKQVAVDRKKGKRLQKGFKKAFQKASKRLRKGFEKASKMSFPNGHRHLTTAVLRIWGVKGVYLLISLCVFVALSCFLRGR